MEREKVKEIKKGLEDNANYEHHNKLGYIDGYKCKTVAYADILTYINELESENERLKWEKQILEDKDTLLAKVGEMVQENQQLKDRLAELENEIENGTLRKAPCKVGDTIYFDTYSRGDSIGVQPHKVSSVEFVVRIEATPGNVGADIPEYEFGKSVFFTAEEAAANTNG